MARVWTVGLALAAAGALTGCDDFRDVAVTNACDGTVEIAEAYSTSQGNPMTLEPDEVAEAHSSGGPFDVLVRAQGASRWQVRVAWEDMAVQDEYRRAIELGGDLCP